ncbi:MAG: phospholipase D-like domain-containing protein [Halobacteriovoraceae bacterium]|nr:phospholipase D-like domain-containing protein [Halobacteriovoraceae bacterium]
MRNVLFALFITFSLLPSFAMEKSFSLQDRIQTQKLYLEVYPLLFKEPLIKYNDQFSKKVEMLEEKEKMNYQATLESLNPHLPPIFLKAILTYRFLKPNSEALEKVLLYSFFHKLFIIRDAIDDPQTKNPIALLNVLRTITEITDLKTDSIYSRLIGVYSEKVKLISNFEDHNAFKDALSTTKLLTFDLKKVLKKDNLFLLNHTGFIPGNRVEVISENQTDMETMKWFSEVKIPFRPIKDHPSFRDDPIFKKLKDVIASAKNTIFIDIFLLGGSIGANLGEFLIETTREKLKNNPSFKVLVLHDYSTKSEVDFEVQPIFDYLKSQREKDQNLNKSLYLLSADTSKHPSGVAFGFSNSEPKIDHSKTLVVDGNYPYAQAFFGSKNWSDHSGGYFYDDVFFIQGPAATMTQASYYRDIEAALNKDSGDYFLNSEQILKDFKITLNKFPYIGKTVVRLTESDVEGTIKNTRNTLIDMIVNAKENIYMEQLFLYDRFIVDALIKAKIKKPKLDIKILLDNNDSYGMNGLPNTLFIQELKKYGIQLRTRKTFKIKSNSPAARWGFLYQENHRKMTSVDGKILLGGSSNLNPDSLQGSFREFGAQVYSHRLTSTFNRKFLKAWKNPKVTQILDIKNFKAKIGGRTISSATSNLINKMGALLLRSKKSLEEN